MRKNMMEPLHSSSESMHRPPRRGDGGVYLVVVDDSQECKLAVRYAGRLAASRRGYVALLKIIAGDEFQAWGRVEAKLRLELRRQAENDLLKAAAELYELSQRPAALYVAEGDVRDALLQTIAMDDTLTMLVLGGGVSAAGPGPLVQHFTTKVLGKLTIPVVIVPGNLDSSRIDAIT